MTGARKPVWPSIALLHTLPPESDATWKLRPPKRTHRQHPFHLNAGFLNAIDVEEPGPRWPASQNRSPVRQARCFIPQPANDGCFPAPEQPHLNRYSRPCHPCGWFGEGSAEGARWMPLCLRSSRLAISRLVRDGRPGRRPTVSLESEPAAGLVASARSCCVPKRSDQYSHREEACDPRFQAKTTSLSRLSRRDPTPPVYGFVGGS